MKRLLLVTLLISMPAVLSAQLKVGVMDPDVVLDALPEAAQVQNELEQFIEQRQTAFQNRYQDWLTEITAFAEAVEAGTMSESDQRVQEERLVEMQEELNNLQMLIERQIQNRQNELFSPLLQRVENAMADVSAELGLDFVLNKTSNTGDPIVYFASRRAPDITERVIQYLTQN